ncbi:MAG: hypothetical protein M1818_003574 [Claussenomyces sp. TS43310]|nr:MAG: hypothetical protein M1818_003574 [Claussenomyces sp. TS43310]
MPSQESMSVPYERSRSRSSSTSLRSLAGSKPSREFAIEDGEVAAGSRAVIQRQMIDRQFFTDRKLDVDGEKTMKAIYEAVKVAFVDPNGWDKRVHDAKLAQKVKMKIDRV